MMPDAWSSPRGPRPEPPPGPPSADGAQQALEALAGALGAEFVLLDGRGRPIAGIGGRKGGVGVRGPSPPRLLALWQRLFPDRDRAFEALSGLRGVVEGVASSFRTRAWPTSGRAVDVTIARCEGPRAGFPRARLVVSIIPPPDDAVVGRTRYRELFEASPDLYLTLDRNGRIEEVNRRAVRVLGYAAPELVGARPLRFLDRPSRRRLLAAVPSLVERGALENLELDVLRRDGRCLHVIANAVAVRDPQGKIAGVRAVLRDVTRRTLLQRQLRQTDRLAATGRLAAGIAHEINNPLQAVLTHLEVVRGTLPRAFEAQDSWARVEEGLARIHEIVEDLLDLHRGKGLEHGPVDVHRVLDETLGLVRTQLRHRGIALEVRTEPELPPVSATFRHVYQIALNLVLNAIDAMTEGGKLTVRTRRSRLGGEVEVDVADTGPGIPEDMLPRLFDPFRTASSEARTGLGLFVTYGLVREYRGRIRVDSQPGLGTTFTFALPVWGRSAGRSRENAG